MRIGAREIGAVRKIGGEEDWGTINTGEWTRETIYIGDCEEFEILS